jgi:hypothetical protein
LLGWFCCGFGGSQNKKMLKNILFLGFIVAVGIINALLVNYAINKCLEVFGSPFC